MAKKQSASSLTERRTIDTALLRALAYMLHRIADEILRIVG